MNERTFPWTIRRSEWDEWVGRPLTDEEWEAVCEEISGRLDNFADGLTEDLIKDIQIGRLLFKFGMGFGMGKEA